MTSSFSLQSTHYGGRGLFATEPIPKDTLLLTCSSPYATVIFRRFRKEVCGNCFAYAFEAKRNAWNIKADAGSGVWFCTPECRNAWLQEQNVEGLQGLMNASVERLAKTMKQPKGPHTPSPAESMLPEAITLEVHDRAWKNAEEKYAHRGCPTAFLDELELDNVRFLVSAIVQRYFEERQSGTSSASWAALLQLQNNEMNHVYANPYMLDSHTRIYGFLRKAILPVLQPYVQTSEMVRAILGRDQGNVFGIWDMSTEGDSEMLGWSMYPTGSYFNHSESLDSAFKFTHQRFLDCSPNVRKERRGRALCFLTIRDVEPGEELCTNYVDVKDEVVGRRAELLRNWYFHCACKRCHEELGLP
ncbi:hypothetical protein H0H81_001759 [Sphagnurus paluster]|uniref:SET domain-containing protein n=1 Tax=Sphagnurus paluster TaxID=117069 RepID=A0A9P7GRD0_9AGAR|nr:hypothetical protein H0H81_001759 [Sphagnurus paluster]